MDYGYLSQKFSLARSSLMLPHPHGEVASVTAAMHECAEALGGVKDQRPERLEPYLSRLISFMDTTGMVDPDGRGLHAVKAESFTDHERHQFANTVDELASKCARYSHEQL
ncbi:hypothetical protein [Variovorax sp. UMC13]|uniref:hypothetical protein n=1 Tax=Variovorax sp. UMC13 TaxID=1862326 RepID=UPI0015FF06C9|nr:hypothetical protein [Variovorax sp. UMC13]MBB1599992.1 hypothetical protein [Variovorax sp. UMC13]